MLSGSSSTVGSDVAVSAADTPTSSASASGCSVPAGKSAAPQPSTKIKHGAHAAPRLDPALGTASFGRPPRALRLSADSEVDVFRALLCRLFLCASFPFLLRVLAWSSSSAPRSFSCWKEESNECRRGRLSLAISSICRKDTIESSMPSSDAL
eukprot:COSAG04_NODE_3476_length_2787_cov_22.650728_3_plen_153_part_00